MKKRIVKLISFLLIFGLITITALWLSRFNADYFICHSNLKNIHSLIYQYSLDHSGKFPQNLYVLYEEYGAGFPEAFICPQSSNIKHKEELDKLLNKRNRNIVIPTMDNNQLAEKCQLFNKYSGYIYIFWPNNKGENFFDYPMVYDRLLANHKGKGINVLSISQKNNYNIYFDKNAEWLTKFAKSHPEYLIPLPEDLSNKEKVEAEITKVRKEKGIKVLNLPTENAKE